MRKESARERDAWTAAVDGGPAPKESKYHNTRSHGYASKHEEKIARDLQVLADGGVISDLREQVPFTLVAGRNGVRGIKYVADFTWIDNQERQDDALCSQASRATATLNLKSWPNGVQDTFGEYVRMVAVRAREARVRAALSIT